MNYEQTVNEIKQLLSRVHSAWVDVFLKLRDVERDGVWKMGGYAHFGDFLREEFPNALGLERYTNGIRAIELYGEDLVRRVGVQAAHAMCVEAVAKDDGRRAQLTESINLHIADHGVAPDVNKIRDMVRGIAPEVVRPSRETRSVQAIAHLKAENAELKKQLRVANRRIKELESELARAQKPVRSTKGGKKAA